MKLNSKKGLRFNFCLKRVFGRAEAKEHAKAATKLYGRPMRTYKCPHCKNYHLTSQILREKRTA